MTKLNPHAASPLFMTHMGLPKRAWASLACSYPHSPGITTQSGAATNAHEAVVVLEARGNRP